MAQLIVETESIIKTKLESGHIMVQYKKFTAKDGGHPYSIHPNMDAANIHLAELRLKKEVK